MSLTVREKWLWQAMTDEKFSGMGAQVPGQPLFVYPGTSATHLGYLRDRHKYVYPTVDLAYADCVSGRGDAIVLMHGAHTLTTALPIAKNNINIFGPDAWMGVKSQRGGATLTALAASDGLTVTGTDFMMKGVTLVPITAKIGITFSALAHRLRLYDNHFDMNVAVASVSTKGVVATGAAVDTYIKGNYFYSLGAHGPFIDVTGLINYTVDDNDFVVLTGGTMAVGILVGAAAQGIIKGNRFYGGTLTAPISGTGATVAGACRIFDNKFGVLCTVPVDNFSATNLTDLCNNYVATIGAGTGGTLVALNT